MSTTDGGVSGAPVPEPGAVEPSQRARLLTIWSWLMLPMLLVSFGVGFAIGVALMGVLGVPEGRMLTQAGAMGRLSAVLVLLIGIVPALVGVVLGRRAVREGGGGPARGALVVNGIVLTYLVVVQVLQQLLG